MSSIDARTALSAFLQRMDRGEMPDFEAFLREHPDEAPVLRRLFQDECERLEAACRTMPADDAIRPRGDTSRLHAEEIVARLSSGKLGPGGRYAIRGEIGKGGMGTVLRVWDGDLRRELAMKVASESATGRVDASRLARFLEEAQITSQLDHPGIVPVHELGLDPDGRVYFTMKLVKGLTFEQVLQLVRDGAEGWTQARALGVIHRVCEAMAYAHDKGVLHRDLKPANVMVGAYGEVYVMDWGLARLVGADERLDADAPSESLARRRSVDSDRSARRSADPSSSLLTAEGQVIGTPAYMPPEQALGRMEDVGPHSDVYSVGAMIYHLLAGRPPHTRDEDAARGATGAPHANGAGPERLPASAPGELAAICEKAMAVDRRARYPDMRAMAADVAAYLEGRVVRAHEAGALAEARKWVKRNRGFALALALGLLSLVVGLVASLALKERSDAHALRAQKIAGFLEETLAGVKPAVALGRDTTMLREMMDAARGRIEAGELAAAPEAELRLLHLIGSTYREIAQYELSEPLLRRAAVGARDLLDRDDPLRAAIVGDLALVLDARGSREEAEVLARESLADRRRLHRGDHVDVASGLQNLAAVLRSQGELDESELLLREGVAMQERLTPSGSEALARVLGNLAVVLGERGDFQGAEGAARRALETARACLPSEHPLVASNANALATLLAVRGDLAGAETLNREALASRRRLNAGDHADTAASLNNLAFVLYQRRDFVGAEQHFREALEMQRRLLRGDHGELASILDNLAATRVAQGDAAGGEALQLEALGMRKRLYPGGHADVALGLHNIASGLRLRGELDRAEPYARDALEMGRRVLPPDHPYLVLMTSNAGLVLEARGDLDGAESRFREALEVGERGGGDDSPSIQRISQCERNLGRVLLHRARYAEAEALLLRRTSATDDRGHLDRLRLLVELYTAWHSAEPGQERADAARAWQQKLDALQSSRESDTD